MAHVCLNLVILAALLISHGVSAKRGCSAFGHSCFGGHGKRSSDTAAIGPSDVMGLSRGQEETPPAPGYPRTLYGLSGDDIIPVRDGGIFDRDDEENRERMKINLRNIVRHWMNTYRQSQNDDGNLAQAL